MLRQTSTLILFDGRLTIPLLIIAVVSSALAWAQHRRLQRLRRQMTDALEQFQGQSRFLAAASHDLRQPLQALGLFVAALAHRQLPPELRPMVDKIEASIENLEQLINTVLDIARFDAGMVEVNRGEVPLEAIFERLAVEFTPVAVGKGLSLVFVHTKSRVESDPALLERILRNLLSNALRYTQQGGVVVGCRRHGPLTRRVEIWDTGTGIAPERQGEILGGSARCGKESRKGAGLGLSVVGRAAVLLGHSIDMRSRPGKGSVFDIILPESSRRADDTSARGNNSFVEIVEPFRRTWPARPLGKQRMTATIREKESAG